MLKSSAALRLLGALAATTANIRGHGITFDESTPFNRPRSLRRNAPRHRYDPVTHRYISAAEVRAMGRNPKYNNHGQPFGVSGNKLARKAHRNQIGKTVLR